MAILSADKRECPKVFIFFLISFSFQIISPNHQFCKEDGILRFADLPHLWKGLVEPEDYSFFLELLAYYGIAYTVPYNTSFLSSSSALSSPRERVSSSAVEKAELTRPVSFSNLPAELNQDNIRIFVPCRMTAVKDDGMLNAIWNEVTPDVEGEESITKTGRRFRCQFLPHVFFSRLIVQILRPHTWKLRYAWGDHRKELCGFVLEKMEKIEFPDKRTDILEERGSAMDISNSSGEKEIPKYGVHFATLRFSVEILPVGNCLQLLGRGPSWAAAALHSKMSILQNNLLELLKSSKYSSQVFLSLSHTFHFFHLLTRFFSPILSAILVLLLGGSGVSLSALSCQ